jgi:hypothetical protein
MYLVSYIIMHCLLQKFSLMQDYDYTRCVRPWHCDPVCFISAEIVSKVGKIYIEMVMRLSGQKKILVTIPDNLGLFHYHKEPG